MPTICIIIDRLPLGFSGQESYNKSIIDTADVDGNHVHYVVTGKFIPDSRKITASGIKNIKFVNAVQIFGFLIPNNFKSFLRSIYYKLPFNPKKIAGKRSAVIGRWLDGAETKKIDKLIKRLQPDCVIVDTIFRLPRSSSFLEIPRRVLITHDVFHLRSQSFKQNGYSVKPDISRAEEKEHYSVFSSIIAINQNDEDEIRNISPESDVFTAYPSISHRNSSPRREPEFGRLFYMGSRAYHNFDGLSWFIDNIFSKLRSVDDRFELNVVGDIALEFKEEHPGVRFWGKVDDPISIAASCQLAVSPVLMGSGLKIKMVDYFQMGLGCVASPVAAYGFPTDPIPPFIIADRDEFCDAILDLVNDPAKMASLERNIPNYLSLFSQQRTATLLRSAIGVQ